MIKGILKPWAGNRHGDPRQLRHEAASLDRSAREQRENAVRLRAEAGLCDEAADRMIDAACDYRQWAKETETAKESDDGE